MRINVRGVQLVYAEGGVPPLLLSKSFFLPEYPKP